MFLREFHINLKEKSSTQKFVRGGFILFLPVSPCLLIRVENASSYGQSKTKAVAVCDIPQPIIEPIKFFFDCTRDLETNEQSESSFFPTAGLLLLLSASTTSLGRQSAL